MSIDVDQLLSELAPEPCGENLEYDAWYLETLKLAEGTPEQQVGDEVIPASEPNWREVRERCVGLFGKTRDLRLGITLLAACLATDGLPGLHGGVTLVRGLLERFWDTLYPQLDPDDDNDPLERTNILVALAAPPDAFGDPLKIQRRIREAPLTNSRQIGRFSQRDVLVATGEIQVDADPESPPPDMALIEGAFEDTSTEDLQANKDAVDAALAEFEALDSFVTDKVGAGRAVDLSSFAGALKEVQKTLQEYLSRRGYGDAVTAEAGTGAGDEVAGSAGTPISGEVRSPQDVLLALDKICRYYESTEPSSPVPLLLKRAQRLVSKNFLEIIRDLSPEALNQIQSIGGIDNSEG